MLTQLFIWTGTSKWTTYDFLSAKQAIQNNVWTDSNLTQFLFWSTFDRIGTYDDHIYYFLSSKQAILSNVRTDFNLT